MSESEPPAPETDAVAQPHQRRETRRWFPRGAVVFFALALLFVLIFVVARPQWFADRKADSTPPELAYTTTLSDLGHIEGIRLSDDGSTSRTITAALPLDSRLDEVHLTLAGRTQVAASSAVFLRVLADGVSVYVAELPAGQHDLNADIALPESVTDDGGVTVQVRITGSLDQRACNPTHELGAFVFLDPEASRIHGRLDRRLHTVRDVVGALDHEVTLELAAPGPDKGWYETAARLGVALTHRGHQVRYRSAAEGFSDTRGSRILLGPDTRLAELGWTPAEDGGSGALRVGGIADAPVLAVVEPAGVTATFMTTDAVTTADAAANEPRVDDPELLAGDSVSLSALGLDTSVQQFSDGRSWRVSYSIADLPGGRVPSEVRLELQVPVTADDARWIVQVQLNGQLVESARLPGDLAAQSVVARIPDGIEALRNDLVVTLLRDRDLGGCNVRPPDYRVQLLPGSSLRLGGRGAGFTAVPSEYAAGFDVYLPTSNTEDPAASLAALVPSLAEFSWWRQQATFVWDGVPSTRPFFLFGTPPATVDVPVRIADGRLVATGFDLQSFRDGLVVQCAAAGPARGLVVIPVGAPRDGMPVYGRETARLVSGDGVGVVVSGQGRIATVPPVRAEGGR